MVFGIILATAIGGTSTFLLNKKIKKKFKISKIINLYLQIQFLKNEENNINDINLINDSTMITFNTKKFQININYDKVDDIISLEVKDNTLIIVDKKIIKSIKDVSEFLKFLDNE